LCMHNACDGCDVAAAETSPGRRALAGIKR
jgi:hypothetical protein